MSGVPWDDLKVAFGISNPERLWRADAADRLDLPFGWRLVETDDAGARSVAVFRVEDTMPTAADARLVKAQLRRWAR